MKRWNVTGVTDDGAPTTRTIDALSGAEAARSAETQGIRVQSVTLDDPPAADPARSTPPPAIHTAPIRTIAAGVVLGGATLIAASSALALYDAGATIPALAATAAAAILLLTVFAR